MDKRRSSTDLYFAAVPGIVFVRVSKTVYIRTHVAVAHAPCPVCKAAVGELCRGGRDGRTPSSSVHYRRKEQAAQRMKRGPSSREP